MKTTINERVMSIVNNRFGGRVNRMAVETGISQTTLRDIVGARFNEPSYSTLIKIINSEKIGINPIWLITGEGCMFNKSDEGIRNTQKVESDNSSMQKELSDIKEENRKLKNKIEFMKAEWLIIHGEGHDYDSDHM